jgi:hypothetical protein
MAQRSTLAELLADPESSTPAIIATSPATVVSYKALAAQVEKLAGQLRGAGLCPHCAWAETIPPRNPYLLRAPIEVASVGTRWSPATFENIVTGAQQHGGGWIIFTIHDVCARACTLGVTRPELGSVLGWLARHAGHGVSVRTVRQVIGGPVRPAVAGPAPRPVPPPGVVNSRLSAVTAAGMPACFQAGRYGTNHATFRYQRRAGPGGAGAEVISLTQRKSGTAQLVPAMDLGACAPAVTAGVRYTLGAWYKSSGPVVFNTYYRTATGTWAFWVTSPPGGALRRHAGHHPVQPGPGPLHQHPADRIRRPGPGGRDRALRRPQGPPSADSAAG